MNINRFSAFKPVCLAQWESDGLKCLLCGAYTSTAGPVFNPQNGQVFLCGPESIPQVRHPFTSFAVNRCFAVILRRKECLYPEPSWLRRIAAIGTTRSRKLGPIRPLTNQQSFSEYDSGASVATMSKVWPEKKLACYMHCSGHEFGPPAICAFVLCRLIFVSSARLRIERASRACRLLFELTPSEKIAWKPLPCMSNPWGTTQRYERRYIRTEHQGCACNFQVPGAQICSKRGFASDQTEIFTLTRNATQVLELALQSGPQESFVDRSLFKS